MNYPYDALGPPEIAVICTVGCMVAVLWVLRQRHKHPVAGWIYNTIRTRRIQPFRKSPHHPEVYPWSIRSDLWLLSRWPFRIKLSPPPSDSTPDPRRKEEDVLDQRLRAIDWIIPLAFSIVGLILVFFADRLARLLT